jgi:hypothetical protein
VSQTTIQNSEQTANTTQDLVETTQQSTRAAWDYALRAQQINVRFAQRFTEAWIDALRRQTELSLELAQEFSGKGEKQADDSQRFFGQWGFPVTGLPFDPVSFWGEWMRFTERTTQAVSSNNRKTR